MRRRNGPAEPQRARARPGGRRWPATAGARRARLPRGIVGQDPAARLAPPDTPTAGGDGPQAVGAALGTTTDDGRSRHTTADQGPPGRTTTDHGLSRRTITDDSPSLRTATDDSPSRRTATDDGPSRRTATCGGPSRRITTCGGPSRRITTSGGPARRITTSGGPARHTAAARPEPPRTVQQPRAARGKIVISANTAWNLVNFRAGLIAALVAAGYEVVAAVPAGAARARVEALGCRVVDIAIEARGTSLRREALLLARYVALMARERPDAFLGFTVKPNIYGGIAARMVGAAVLDNVCGLGAAFAGTTPLAGLVRRLYRHALGGAHTVFFQNDADRALFEAARIVRPAQAALLPGSGVDLARFAPPPEPPRVRGAPAGPVFLLVARLLRDKGIAEYVAAARALTARHPGAKFRLLGFLEMSGHGAAVTAGEIAAWEREGVIEYCGAADDVRPFLAAADCVVLPSYYREGTPRTLLEAAAMARPIVTTTLPGCRDTVQDGISGFLVPPRDAAALTAALERIVALGPEARRAMGMASRRLAQSRFDEAIVIRAYLAALERALA